MILKQCFSRIALMNGAMKKQNKKSLQTSLVVVNVDSYFVPVYSQLI